MSFFDLSHVTDVGLQGSTGPPVSFTDMISQSFQQQFRVDSARALDDELRNRWLESLHAAQISDQITVAPDPLGQNPRVDPDDPWAYRAFAQHVSGQPIDTFDPNKSLWGYDPGARIKAMVAANEKIKALNNPNIKSFEQILEEVSQMQRETEGTTALMYDRSGTGGFVASLIGAIGGSFTTRDPLNLITAPVGAGRTIAMRVATDMGLAAAVVGYTELAEVAPAREMVGLPVRNPLYNIGAAALGAGVIRGGLEGLGIGVRHLRSEPIDFDLRDSQLQQMFEANSEKPSARAGASILSDVTFIERNNPYGEGHQANLRFMAELQSMQRAMNGEPMTAVARVLPPLPFEQLKKVADFEIVREQALEIYGRMEAAQAKVAGLREGNMSFERVSASNLDENTNVIKFTRGKIEGELIWKKGETEAGINIYGEGPNTSNVAELRAGLADIKEAFPELKTVRGVRMSGSRKETPEVVRAALDKVPTAERRAANVEYQAAYRQVEVEATRIREQQAAVEAKQRREFASILMPTAEGRPFIGPLLQHDYVETLVERINKFNETLNKATAARFVREAIGEGEEAVEREVWRTDAGIDIGLKDPVDPEFRFETDEGEMTVAQAMRDLQDDTDLDEAMRTCLL